MEIRPGDRVKLTEHGARVNSKTMSTGKSVDWYTRRGTVVSIGRVWFYIIWDGTKSKATEMPLLLELAED